MKEDMIKRFPEVLALIPARSGSKGIIDKNIRLIGGIPLLAHSIKHAESSTFVTRIIVSTDSSGYAELAQQYGAEVPFLRPSDISQDTSTDLEAFTHSLNWLKDNESYVPDICVHLRPTYPVRKSEEIDQMVRILLENPDIDSVRGIVLTQHTPFKMWFRKEDGCLTPVVENKNLKESYNLPRQLLPRVYYQNNNTDVFRTSVITEKASMTGDKIYGYLMEDNFDIDTEAHFAIAVTKLTASSSSTMRKT